MADVDPVLSVVVMGYRNADTITDAVRSVVEQRCDVPFEVVVVISGPEDGADRVRRAFPGVPVVHHPSRLMPGGTRNLGVAHTRGTTIAFLAGDCLAEPGWVQARIRAHAEGHVAVSCAVTNAGRATPWTMASLLLLWHNRLPGRSHGPVGRGDPRAHGFSVRRDVLTEVGLFDPDLRIGEDTDMAARLMAAGHAICFRPEIRVAHRSPASTWQFLHDQARRARRSVVGGFSPPCTERGPALLLEQLRFAWRRTRRAASFGWHFAAEGRAAVLLSVPWIFAGALAHRVGWWSAWRAVGSQPDATTGDRVPYDASDVRAS